MLPDSLQQQLILDKRNSNHCIEDINRSSSQCKNNVNKKYTISLSHPIKTMESQKTEEKNKNVMNLQHKPQSKR
jgi:hypothetical protein